MRVVKLSLWLFGPLLVGLILGTNTSKVLWGYYWFVPHVTIEEGAQPTGFSIFHVGPTEQILSKSERNRLIEAEFHQCRMQSDDCAFGKTLLAIDKNAGWERVPETSLDRAALAPLMAEVSRVPPFLRVTQPGVGMLIEYTVNSRRRTVIALSRPN